MKKSALLASVLPLVAFMSGSEHSSASNPKARIFSGEKNHVIRKGMTRFVINGKVVWALNHKNAVRKASKI